MEQQAYRMFLFAHNKIRSTYELCMQVALYFFSFFFFRTLPFSTLIHRMVAIRWKKQIWIIGTNDPFHWKFFLNPHNLRANIERCDSDEDYHNINFLIISRNEHNHSSLSLLSTGILQFPNFLFTHSLVRRIKAHVIWHDKTNSTPSIETSTNWIVYVTKERQ